LCTPWCIVTACLIVLLFLLTYSCFNLHRLNVRCQCDVPLAPIANSKFMITEIESFQGQAFVRIPARSSGIYEFCTMYTESCVTCDGAHCNCSIFHSGLSSQPGLDAQGMLIVCTCIHTVSINLIIVSLT